MKIIKIYIVLTLVVSMTGCSMFAEKHQMLGISSSPTGATIAVNGKDAGKTPTTISIQRNVETSVIISKDGYIGATRTTRSDISPIGILDIVGGTFLILPFIGLLSPGAWQQNPTNISVVLDKETN